MNKTENIKLKELDATAESKRSLYIVADITDKCMATKFELIVFIFLPISIYKHPIIGANIINATLLSGKIKNIVAKTIELTTNLPVNTFLYTAFKYLSFNSDHLGILLDWLLDKFNSFEVSDIFIFLSSISFDLDCCIK